MNWYREQYRKWEEREAEHEEQEDGDGDSDGVDAWQLDDGFRKSVAGCIDVFLGCKDKPSALRAAMDVASAIWVQEGKIYAKLVKRIRKLYLQTHPDKNKGREHLVVFLFDALNLVVKRVQTLQAT